MAHFVEAETRSVTALPANVAERLYPELACYAVVVVVEDDDKTRTVVYKPVSRTNVWQFRSKESS